MTNNKTSSRTLVLALPAHCEDAVAATEKWLLSLWQASSKSRWSLWRSRACISLEYVVEQGGVRYQVHLQHAFLADVTRTLLQAHVPGIETATLPDPITAGPRCGATATFRPRHPGWIELPKDRAADGVSGVLQALAALPHDATAMLQLYLQPTWMTTEDGKQPAFHVAGRITAFAHAEPTAVQGVQLVASALGQFSGFNGVRTSRPRRCTSALSALTRRWPRRLFPTDPVLTAAQVALLYHPPEHPNAYVQTIDCRHTPAPESREGISLGAGRDRHGVAQPVRVVGEDLLRHALVVGPSGSGKTTFLAHLARELARAGHGVTVLDPHGGLVRAIARTMPASRLSDTQLLRFADTNYPIAINPLHARAGQESLAADELVEILQRVQGREYWGPLLDLQIRHAALASIEVGGSLLDTARLLDDPWFRERTVARIENPETARFLGRLGNGPSDDRRLLPAVNRLQRFLATPWLRNTLGQNRRGLDFGEIFDQRSIALCDLSGIGTTHAKLLGSLLLLLIRQAAFERDPQRVGSALHFVLVDEASWFISRTVGELADQARKFGVGLVLATQRLGQLTPEDTREAVLANSGSVLSFRIHDRDEANFLTHHFGSEQIDSHDLQHLGRYEAYVQLTRDGERLEPAWLQAPAPTAAMHDPEVELQMIAAARERYARPRAVVEAALRSRERALDVDAEPEIRALPPSAFLAHAA